MLDKLRPIFLIVAVVCLVAVLVFQFLEAKTLAVF